MQLFSAEAKVFSKFFKKISDPKNMKKPPSKVAHNRPPTSFNVLVRLPKRPKNRNLVPPKSPLMKDWVFRLGSCLCSGSVMVVTELLAINCPSIMVHTDTWGENINAGFFLQIL